MWPRRCSGARPTSGPRPPATSGSERQRSPRHPLLEHPAGHLVGGLARYSGDEREPHGVGGLLLDGADVWTCRPAKACSTPPDPTSPRKWGGAQCGTGQGAPAVVDLLTMLSGSSSSRWRQRSTVTHVSHAGREAVAPPRQLVTPRPLLSCQSARTPTPARCRSSPPTVASAPADDPARSEAVAPARLEPLDGRLRRVSHHHVAPEAMLSPPASSRARRSVSSPDRPKLPAPSPSRSRPGRPAAHAGRPGSRRYRSPTARCRPRGAIGTRRRR